MINIDKLKVILATKHGIIIDEKDPIFASVVLSDEVLKGYIKLIDSKLSNTTDTISLINETHKNNLDEQLTVINNEQNLKFERILNELKSSSESKADIQYIKNSSFSYFTFFLGVAAGALFVFVALAILRTFFN